MWRGDYESCKVLADAYYMKRAKKIPVFHAVVVHGLDFIKLQKNRDVPAELLVFLINLLLLSVPVVVVS